MTIKDAEKLTGLTAKSIRLYESKGLITVERNSENDYRDYTEENIKQLKRIKIYRYFNFSIEEIRGLLSDDGDALLQKLQAKTEKFYDETEDLSSKRDLLDSLSKDLLKGKSEIEDYADVIDFLECDEMTELMETVDEISIPSLTSVIIQTLIFLGPIACLFLNIATGMYKALAVNAVLAILSTVLITLTWLNYFKKRKQKKAKVKRKNKEHSYMWIVMLASLVASIGSIIGGSILICEKYLAPENWLFYETSQGALYFLIFSVILLSAFGCVLAGHVLSNFKNIKNYKPNIKKISVWVSVLGILYCSVMYFCLTNTVYVTEQSIVVHSPFNPLGTEYRYEDVEKIETGFGKKSFAVLDYKKKGNFYYTLEIDGKKVIFTGPNTSAQVERYEENTYLELEEFDRKLVDLGIEKESSEKYYDYCALDGEYVDRFLRIINNK